MFALYPQIYIRVSYAPQHKQRFVPEKHLSTGICSGGRVFSTGRKGLFVCSLFTDTVGNSDSTWTNDCMTVNNNADGSGRWICLEKLWNITKILNSKSRHIGRHSKRASSEYKIEAFPLDDTEYEFLNVIYITFSKGRILRIFHLT
jgi:hypothetical protein